LVIGTLLLAPAGFMARARVAPSEVAAQAIATTLAPMDEALEANVAVEPEAAHVRTAVMAAWRDNVLERQRQELTSRLAVEFDVSLDLASEIHLAAVEEEVDPVLAFKLVRAESSFRTSAVSPVGAIGLTQLLPSTARWLVPGTSRRDLFEPRTNLRVGFRYLRHLLDRFEGDQHLALTAYNRGPGTVSALVRKGRDPSNGYAEMVLTGSSERHVTLMTAKFGRKNRRTD
jgi:soluble lytic murein transglycosylase-like protein